MMVDLTKFRVQMRLANPTFGMTKTPSSLDPLLKELGTQPSVMLDPIRKKKVQEAVFHIPYLKQQKYKRALEALKPAGIVACGRPCDPTMHFVRFEHQVPYVYVGRDAKGLDKQVDLKPGAIGHVFDFKWKSTTGDMKSLATVHTREWVKFRTSQRTVPFNDAMPPDMEFYWGQSYGAQSGLGRDCHSIKPPRLVCRFPWTAGENVAEQWYQYSLDGQTWHNIPGAAYLLVKGVRGAGKNAAFYFRKESWAPHNPKPYRFEAEYPLGEPLAYQPKPGSTLLKFMGSEDQLSKYGRIVSRG